MSTELDGIVRASAWMMRVLQTIYAEQLPDAWTGAGVLRDLVWGERFGAGFEPAQVHDVDVAFYDPHELTRDHDDQITAQLRRRDPCVPWEAKNQAAVHFPVKSFCSTSRLIRANDAMVVRPGVGVRGSAKQQASDVRLQSRSVVTDVGWRPERGKSGHPLSAYGPWTSTS
jgi:hypothetical protein